MPAPVCPLVRRTDTSLTPVDASPDPNATALSTVGGDLDVPCQTAPRGRSELCIPRHRFAGTWGARSEVMRPAQSGCDPPHAGRQEGAFFAATTASKTTLLGIPASTATAAIASLRRSPASSRTRTLRTSSASPISSAPFSGAPSTTTVISPRTPSAAHSARKPSSPRLTSSYVFVSSRHTAARRSVPNTSAIAPSVSSSRCGASKYTSVRRSSATSRSRESRSPPLRGRNPSKQNRSTGSPDSASAVRTADGPGTAVTRTSFSTPAATSRYPGSDTDGIPASVTSNTRAPPRSSSTSSGVRAASLPSKYDTIRPLGVTPSPWVSRRSRRVSSAATTSAPASSAASRGGASARSPMGVPAKTRVPVTPPSSQGRPEPDASTHARDSHSAVPYDGAVTSTASSTDTRQDQAPQDRRPSWQQRLRRFGYTAEAARSDVRERLVPPFVEPSP